uniref:Ig-like domain-containing protein n=1 Tax=Crocodylus porosus TaxID=8502 RepID=A0A7M4FXU4_CROPO
MLLGPAVLYLFTCLHRRCVLWAIKLDQDPPVIIQTAHRSSTAELICKVTGGSESRYIHWYRALPGEAPQRILYYSYSNSLSIITFTDSSLVIANLFNRVKAMVWH